jgi:L-aspartate oxidase
VHGANRLASNSLLEGMVFGPRAVEAIAAGVVGPTATGAMRAVVALEGGPGTDEVDLDDDMVIGGRALTLPELPAPRRVDDPTPAVLRARLQQSMSIDAGVIRSEQSLRSCLQVIADTLAAVGGSAVGESGVGEPTGVEAVEVDNLARIAWVLVGAALARTESRGTHSRSDHPELDPLQTHRLVVGGGSPEVPTSRATLRR